ncbi:MAG: glycoside hydrolase TIM-barrel-like domain-containing protein, partial [Phenylobacterium sp.]|nr:glycoside hydrolase TIM-barrel-like domain-containing protein [Phenylobacterium sp.]
TPITDTAHGEDWVFRVKDLKGWWSNAHHDRPGGARNASPTAWTPGMKPIRLTEFGCAAVDRGGNAPNLFLDPKSAESALPPFSTGGRDDRMQRRVLEAVIEHFQEPGNNPVSSVYGGPMLAAEDVWCWDARPWPAFPGREEVWADAGGWRTGHWLNGRLAGETRDLIAAVLRRGGLADGDFEIGGFAGEVQGYVIDRPMRSRDALEPLLAGLGLVAAERGGRVAVIGGEAAVASLTLGELALPDEGASLRVERVLEPGASAARVRYIDGDAGYQTGSVVIRSDGQGGGVDLDLPAVCSGALARSAAERALEAGGADRLMVLPGPVEAMALEPGDTVMVEGRGGAWRVMRLDLDETPSVVLEPLSTVLVGEDDGRPTAGEASAVPGAPFFRMIELPPLIGSENDGRPIAVTAADPWRPMRVFAGASAEALTARGDIADPATVGVLMQALPRGVRHRWDETNTLLVRVEGRTPESLAATAVFAGGNAAAIETATGWELVQFRSAMLVGEGVWRLTGLLRGQQGTEAEGAASGGLVVFLDRTPARAASPRAERGLPLIWRAGPAGGPAGGARVSEIGFTATGVHDRPWAPAHLRATARADGGFDLGWIARSRIDGDRWDGEAIAGDPPRFRVRVMDGGSEARVLEVEMAGAVYAAADAAADFPVDSAPASRSRFRSGGRDMAGAPRPASP